MPGVLGEAVLPEALTRVPGRLAALGEALAGIAAACQDVSVVLVGSCAEADFDDLSDIDLVLVHRGPVPRRALGHVVERARGGHGVRVDIVEMTAECLMAHVRWRTTMAHAVARGVVLRDPARVVAGVLPRLKPSLGPPARGWMRERLCRELRLYYAGLFEVGRWAECGRGGLVAGGGCRVGGLLPASAVELAILLAEAGGVVPTTRRQVLKAVESCAPAWVVDGVAMAVRLVREGGRPGPSELSAVARAAGWMKRRLVDELCADLVDREEALILAATNRVFRRRGAKQAWSGPSSGRCWRDDADSLGRGGGDSSGVARAQG